MLSNQGVLEGRGGLSPPSLAFSSAAHKKVLPMYGQTVNPFGLSPKDVPKDFTHRLCLIPLFRTITAFIRTEKTLE
eukprot:1754301-Amphidinium_carterae.1